MKISHKQLEAYAKTLNLKLMIHKPGSIFTGAQINRKTHVNIYLASNPSPILYAQSLKEARIFMLGFAAGSLNKKK